MTQLSPTYGSGMILGPVTLGVREWLARQDEAWVGEITLAVDRLHAWKPFAQKQLPYRSM